MTAAPVIHKVLLVTAFQEMSVAAVPHACMLARMNNAELTVLHVVPLPPALVRAGPDLSAIPDMADSLLLQRMDDTVNTALKRVREFVETRIIPQGCRAIPAARIGIVWDEIVTHARENHIDLIVLGTRRHGMLRRMLLGSVTKAVIEHAPCPVLLVPLDDGRSDSSADKAA